VKKSEGVDKDERMTPHTLPERQHNEMVELGREAREASLDAHGDLVKPEVAFDFIRTMLYETEDERYESLGLEEINDPTLPFLVGYFGMV
jgi:hypothetical protein